MNQKKPICLGVVGIGFGQQVHVPVFQASDKCEVLGLCASTLDRASRVAQRLGIPRSYGDWRELLGNQDIDAVAIATPPELQPKVALEALALGKAVFCEKPLALTPEAAHQMVQAAAAAGVANMVDFEFPEIASWRRSKSLLDDGAIGSLRHVNVCWQVETYANKMGVTSWKTDPRSGGGTLFSSVSHTFYYLEWFVGPIQRLSAKLFRPPADDRPGDTFDALCLELASGVPATLSVCTHAFLGNGHRIEFYGDSGALVLRNNTSDYVTGFELLHGTRETQRLLPLDRTGNRAGQDGRIDAVACIANRFLKWISTGERSVPSFKNGMRVQHLLEAARQSHEQGSWVECSPEPDSEKVPNG